MSEKQKLLTAENENEENKNELRKSGFFVDKKKE